MPSLLIKDTLKLGICQLIGHKVDVALNKLVSANSESIETKCERCEFPISLIRNGNKILIKQKY